MCTIFMKTYLLLLAQVLVSNIRNRSQTPSTYYVWPVGRLNAKILTFYFLYIRNVYITCSRVHTKKPHVIQATGKCPLILENSP